MIEKVTSVKIVSDLSKVDTDILGFGSALYVRVTREESVKQGLSIPNQKDRGVEIAAARGWNWLKLYIEPRHVGGDVWIDKRPALRELVEDLKTGKIKRVFARHNDRFWRHSEIRDQLLKIFREYEVEFWDFDGMKDYRTASGKFALKVQGDASEYEKDITGERIREMKRGKAKSGRSAGGPPAFGYTSQPRLTRELTLKGLGAEEAYAEACKVISNAHEWYIDHKEAEAIILIISAYLYKNPNEISNKPLEEYPSGTRERLMSFFQSLKGPTGLRTISNILNANGYARRSGEPWVPSKSLRIINDPTIFGFVTFDEDSYQQKRPSTLPKFKQELYKAVHEPIVKPELWQVVQSIKQSNTVDMRTRQKTGKPFPLSKIIFCGQCGSPMTTRSLGSSRPFAYYVCRNRMYYGTSKVGNPKACDFPTVNVAQVESAVWSWLTELLQEKDHIASFIMQSNAKLDKVVPDAKSIESHKRKELEIIDRHIQKYYRRYEAATDPAEEQLAWDKLVQLKKQKNELTLDVEELQKESANSSKEEFSEEQVKSFLQVFHSFLIKNKEKRKFLYQLLHRKHNFYIVARSKYSIQPKINLSQEHILIEINPEKCPASDEDAFFYADELAYRPRITFEDIHTLNRTKVESPTGLLVSGYGSPGPRRTDEKNVVGTRRRDFKRAFGVPLTFDFRKIMRGCRQKVGI